MFMLGSSDFLYGVASASGVQFSASGDLMTTSGPTDAFGGITHTAILTAGGTIINSPASGTVLLVRSAMLANSTNAAITVNLYWDGSTNAYQYAQFVIPAYGRVEHSDDGWKLFDGNGNFQQSLTATAIQNIPVSSSTPNNEQTLVYNSSLNQYVPGFSRSYATRVNARTTWF